MECDRKHQLGERRLIPTWSNIHEQRIDCGGDPHHPPAPPFLHPPSLPSCCCFIPPVCAASTSSSHFILHMSPLLSSDFTAHTSPLKSADRLERWVIDRSIDRVIGVFILCAGSCPCIAIGTIKGSVCICGHMNTPAAHLLAVLWSCERMFWKQTSSRLLENNSSSVSVR